MDVGSEDRHRSPTEGVSDGGGHAFSGIYLPHITRSDWLTDPSQPEELKCSKLLNAGDEADGKDGPTMHFGIAPRKVDEIRRRTGCSGGKRHEGSFTLPLSVDGRRRPCLDVWRSSLCGGVAANF